MSDVTPTASPVETPVETSPASVPDDWRQRLTDDDRALLRRVLREYLARNRPHHREALDLQHRIQGDQP